MPDAKKKTVAPAARGKSGRPGGRPPGVAKVKKAGPREWIGGARLRTLPLAVAPVALGTATAYIVTDDGWHWVRALLCLAVALGLQIAVNYANDYSDGVRGTDKNRVGPSRLTGSGAASPRAVLGVALAFFGLAALAGIALVVLTGFYWLLAVGAVCIVAAWFYTGGKKPYGYNALGEVAVFVFFGLVATAGTMYVQVGEVSFENWLAGTAIGLISVAVLVINNTRDIQQDKLAGKRTLSVLIGNRASRILFAVLLLAPYGILVVFTLEFVNAYFAYATLLIALPAVIIALTAKTAKELILVLQLTSFAGLAYGLILSWAIAF
ncbi:1,4-dihydroxy-2-naphthoate octaprenyltransferase [Conyzicola lurida]|uniref:1,4-dihydroxy-2-naphthoate octaprenyltransferase n=1 Tax=Conyzicola lurida TaxID=1172621 RepID=A0A841AQN4_9MICO|nr:1,4-dihydroxy-2-naphthoate octaprenyltransferase [Conyzicola lurida]